MIPDSQNVKTDEVFCLKSGSALIHWKWDPFGRDLEKTKNSRHFPLHLSAGVVQADRGEEGTTANAKT